MIKIAREVNSQVKREECRALIGRIEIENQLVELVKPQTFMNLSGEAINCLLKKETRSAENLVVISDDLLYRSVKSEFALKVLPADIMV